MSYFKIAKVKAQVAADVGQGNCCKARRKDARLVEPLQGCGRPSKNEHCICLATFEAAAALSVLRIRYCASLHLVDTANRCKDGVAIARLCFLGHTCPPIASGTGTVYTCTATVPERPLSDIRPPANPYACYCSVYRLLICCSCNPHRWWCC